MLKFRKKKGEELALDADQLPTNKTPSINFALVKMSRYDCKQSPSERGAFALQLLCSAICFVCALQSEDKKKVKVL
jgi:hypothetical protein